jgi:hypothetical protein
MIGNLPPKSYLDLESLSNLSILLHHHRFADLRTTSSQIEREIRDSQILILEEDLILDVVYFGD